jgi:hypothetical protein
MPPPTTACGWDFDPSLLCTECDSLLDLPAELQTLFINMATHHLWTWTGRRYGSCPRTVRACETCLTTCTRCHRSRSAVTLPGPASSVTAITIDGTPIPALDLPLDFIIEDWTMLIQTDPTSTICCSPCYGREWIVTYNQGFPVPPGGLYAAASFACELAKGYCNESTCRLPRRIAAMTRQGVSVAFFELFQSIPSGSTGLFEVDTWVAANKDPLGSGSVYSPDSPPARQQTWPDTDPASLTPAASSPLVLST